MDRCGRTAPAVVASACHPPNVSMARAAAGEGLNPMPGSGSASVIARTSALVGAAGPVFYILLRTVLGMMWADYDPIRGTNHRRGPACSPLAAKCQRNAARARRALSHFC